MPTLLEFDGFHVRAPRRATALRISGRWEIGDMGYIQSTRDIFLVIGTAPKIAAAGESYVRIRWIVWNGEARVGHKVTRISRNAQEKPDADAH